MTTIHKRKFNTLMTELNEEEWVLDEVQNNRELYVRLRYRNGSPKQAMLKLARAQSVEMIWRAGRYDEIYCVRIKG